MNKYMNQKRKFQFFFLVIYQKQSNKLIRDYVWCGLEASVLSVD